jgi:hypothetical protein
VGDRVGRDGEDVGRCREEAEGDIPALGQQAHGQRVDGAGHADVGGAVGVDVVAEHQRAVQAGQPVGDRGNVEGQVEARALREILATRLGQALAWLVVPDRDEQRPSAASRCLQDPRPDGRLRQVHPDHPDPPVQQHRHRAHFGARPERHDRTARQGEPLRMSGDRLDRVRAGRLDGTRGDPRVQLTQQGTAAQLLTAVGHGHLAFRHPAAGHRDRGQPVPRGCRDHRAECGLRVVQADAHPAVQRGQPVPGQRHRSLPRGQSRLDQPAKMRQVASTPVGFPPRRQRPRRVGPGQGIGDDGLGQRRRAPAAVRRDGKGHPGRLAAARRRFCRHQTIMTCGL